MSTAVVTGAAGGIGNALVRRVLGDRWQVDAQDAVPGDVEGVVWRWVDICDLDAVAAAAAEVERCEPLFSGAGGGDGAGQLVTGDRDQPDRDGPLLPALYPALEAARGVAVNVASTRSYQSATGRSA